MSTAPATKKAWGQLTDWVLSTLEELGPMTSGDLRDAYGEPVSTQVMSALLHRLNHARKTVPRRIYIRNWVFDSEGERSYWRAVYAIGNKSNATKPPADPAAANRRFRARRKAQATSANIFAQDRRYADLMRTIVPSTKRRAAVNTPAQKAAAPDEHP